ncbi:MAG: T9SS type A sorting domain-containing protein [Bacteroidales bacterium]|nr:T9SS type A sorting domain-containing protein [Bacteroidales bacterium]
MKKRILPFGLFSFLIFGLAALFLMSADLIDDQGITKDKNDGGQSISTAWEYLAKIRNNQHTGLLNPKDVIKARRQAESQVNYKNSSALNIDWVEIGPNNIAGRTRTLIFDNRDPNNQTLYAAGVSGGIFKSTNYGSIWKKVNQNSGNANLNVSCMVQTDDGTIYVGTGEGFNIQNYSGLEDFGYESGFVGKGLFKSDGSDQFNLVEGTQPVFHGDSIDWGYINELAIDTKNNRLFAATNNSLNYAGLPNLNNWQSDCMHALDSILFFQDIEIDSIVTCDTFMIVNEELQFVNPVYTIDTLRHDTTDIQTDRSWVPFGEGYGNIYDVKVSPEGWIIAVFNDKIYVSSDGDPNKFVNRSIYPENPDGSGKNMKTQKSNIVVYDTLGNLLHQESHTYSIEGSWGMLVSSKKGFPNSEDGGRTEFAIAPSDPNIVYAVVSDKGNNSLLNIYLSADAGETWRIIAPGGAESINILGTTVYNEAGDETVYYTGDAALSIAVYPNDPYHILVGSVNMWDGYKVSETGFYQWRLASQGDVAISLGLGILDPLYCHFGHHQYVFDPGTSSKVLVATNGGIYFGKLESGYFNYQVLNRNLNITQFYSVGISGEIKEVIGGAQDMGSIYISGEGSSPQNGEDLWQYQNSGPLYPEGTDGGIVAFSTFRGQTPAVTILPATFFAKGPFPAKVDESLPNRMRRSESLGFDYSSNFLDEDMENDNFLTPMALWEHYNFQMSRDSIKFVAGKNFEAGENVVIRSNIIDHPFNYTLPVSLNVGDSLMVQDIFAARLYVATTDEIWMTKEALDFAVTPEWFKISASTKAGFVGNPTCIAYSTDGNYVYVGSLEGRVYRISNLVYAWDYNSADVASPNCVVASTRIILYEGNSQVVTSISVDPDNPDKVLVTLGNYGNENYVYYSNNATSDSPTFSPVQGNLPQMPVYASLLEMDDETNIAMIGTEEGVWVSDNVSSGEWYAQTNNIGKVPVMDIKQQTLYKTTFVLTYYDPVTNEPFYEIYPGIHNRGYVYVATYGRGIFQVDMGYPEGIDDQPFDQTDRRNDLMVYPNPASNAVNFTIDLQAKSNVVVSIYDLAGKVIYSSTLTGLNRGEHSVPVNLATVREGTYIVKVATGNEIRTTKLVIIK